MTFLSILFALLIEQLRPLRSRNPVYDGVRRLARDFRLRFDAGARRDGVLAWFAVMGLVLIPVLLVYWLCWHIHPLLMFVWNVAIVYLTLGLRHYSHFFSGIQLALSEGDLPAARRILGEWMGQPTAWMEMADVSRLSVERAILTSHRHVFGVFFWFLIPVGPAGAVLYRISDYLARNWNEVVEGSPAPGPFGEFAARMFFWIDWIPARLSAIAFAIVGNFEEAVFNWRSIAAMKIATSDQIVLASAAGAMGVRLDSFPAHAADTSAGLRETTSDSMIYPSHGAFEHSGSSAMFDIASEITQLQGVVAGPAALRSTVGLIWRALLIWMLVLLLFSITVWIS